jgi:hypothetical protein
VAAITKTPSNTWKAISRKRGWPTTVKTFRTKRDAEDWAPAPRMKYASAGGGSGGKAGSGDGLKM